MSATRWLLRCAAMLAAMSLIFASNEVKFPAKNFHVESSVDVPKQIPSSIASKLQHELPDIPSQKEQNERQIEQLLSSLKIQEKDRLYDHSLKSYVVSPHDYVDHSHDDEPPISLNSSAIRRLIQTAEVEAKYPPTIISFAAKRYQVVEEVINDAAFPGFPVNKPELCDINGKLGCFDKYGDFYTGEGQRAVNPAPMLLFGNSEKVTRFNLYKYADNATEPVELKYQNDLSVYDGMFNDRFKKNLETKIIVHGYMTEPRKSDKWQHEMALNYLNVDYEKFNVIVVDWSDLNRLMYWTAVSNTRVVGRQIALLAKHLKDVHGADLSKFHCIGHSLGAHTCGYAGDWLNRIALGITNQPQNEIPLDKIETLRNKCNNNDTTSLMLGRITGLDPAGPSFENTARSVRLDQSDAAFVDIIHTNIEKGYLLTKAFGIKAAIGHVDFYPNSGAKQPKCSGEEEAGIPVVQEVKVRELRPEISPDFMQMKTLDPFRTDLQYSSDMDLAKIDNLMLFKDMSFYISCDHSRSIQLFTDSILDRNIKSIWLHERPVTHSDDNPEDRKSWWDKVNQIFSDLINHTKEDRKKVRHRIQCDYAAYNCKDWEQFNSGECVDCRSLDGRCAKMGSDAVLYKPPQPYTDSQSVITYLKTLGEAPFCGLYYNVELITANKPEFKVSGQMKLRLHARSSTMEVKLTNKRQTYQDNHSYNSQVMIHDPIGMINNVTLEATEGSIWDRLIGKDNHIWVEMIRITEMFRAKSGRQYQFTADPNNNGVFKNNNVQHRF